MDTMDTLLSAKAHVTRHFSAPPQRVFDAWLDSKTAAKWLFARSTAQITSAEIDPRVGGWFSIVEYRNGKNFEHMGEYLEMDRPNRLVFILFAEKYSLEFERVTVVIHPQGCGCELNLTHETKQDLVGQIRRDWIQVLDGLAAVLEPSGGDATRPRAEALAKPA
jgi:uncharacterized protein YndB with AHSA1/START domain